MMRLRPNSVTSIVAALAGLASAAAPASTFDRFVVARTETVIASQTVMVYQLFARFTAPTACNGVTQFRLVEGTPTFLHRDFESELTLSTKLGSWNPQQTPLAGAALDSYLAVGSGVGPMQGPQLGFTGFPSNTSIPQLPLASVADSLGWSRLGGPQVVSDANGLVLLGQFVMPTDEMFHAAVEVVFAPPSENTLTERAFGEVVFSPTDFDACPDDPAKTLPGLCGCGTPDSDSDGDLQPDCIDPFLPTTQTLHWSDSTEPSFDVSLWGATLAHRGNLLAVGAPTSRVPGSGASLTFGSRGGVLLAERTQDGWLPSSVLFEPTLPESGPEARGWVVALGQRADGADVVVAGCARDPYGNQSMQVDGSVVVWSRASRKSPWHMDARLLPPAPAAPGSGPGNFGTSIATSGDRIAIAEPYGLIAPGTRAARIHMYRFVGGGWQKTAELVQPPPSAVSFATPFPIALDGERLLVGNPIALSPEIGFACGRVSIYRLDATNPKTGAENWTLAATLSDPHGQRKPNRFGSSISIDGERMAIGAKASSDIVGSRHGSVEIYRRDQTTASGWRHENTVRPVLPDAYRFDTVEHAFGTEVSLRGDVLSIDSGYERMGDSLGMSVYRRAAGSNWVPVSRLESSAARVAANGALVAGQLAIVVQLATGCATCTNGRVELLDLGLGDGDGDGVIDPDHDGDGLADILDPDANGNGVDDVAELFADLNGDGSIGSEDLAILLANWGRNGLGDLDRDGVVGARDLAALLSSWQP
jgi:hypothetical protein